MSHAAANAGNDQFRSRPKGHRYPLGRNETGTGMWWRRHDEY